MEIFIIIWILVGMVSSTYLTYNDIKKKKIPYSILDFIMVSLFSLAGFLLLIFVIKESEFFTKERFNKEEE